MVGRPRMTRTPAQLQEIESLIVDTQLRIQRLQTILTTSYRSTSRQITILNRLIRDVNHLLQLTDSELGQLESSTDEVAVENHD